MTGFMVLKPTVGMARHSSGRSEMSAPEEKAFSPAADSTATRCSEASNAMKAAWISSATPLLTAFSRSGRLMRMIRTGPWSSTTTTDMVFP